MIHNNITDRNTINEMDEEWERIENDKRLLEAVVPDIFDSLVDIQAYDLGKELIESEKRVEEAGVPDIFDSLVDELLYGLVKVIIGM